MSIKQMIHPAALFQTKFRWRDFRFAISKGRILRRTSVATADGITVNFGGTPTRMGLYLTRACPLGKRLAGKCSRLPPGASGNVRFSRRA